MKKFISISINVMLMFSILGFSLSCNQKEEKIKSSESNNISIIEKVCKKSDKYQECLEKMPQVQKQIGDIKFNRYAQCVINSKDNKAGKVGLQIRAMLSSDYSELCERALGDSYA